MDRPDDEFIAAVFEQAGLSLDELCRAASVSQAWVCERVDEGLLAVGVALDAPPAQWRFDAPAVARARLMRRLERDFDAVPELAALVADLHDEIRALRARLQRAGLA